MKKIIALLFFISFVSCKSDDNVETVTATFAIPEVMSKTDWRSQIEVQVPKPIENVGKIYVYNDFIFIGEEDKGVHVFDNSNPTSPQIIAFLNIPGNEDIAIKNNFLFADSAIDLIVFGISNINGITQVALLEDVFDYYEQFDTPDPFAFTDYSDFNPEEEVIVGWTYEERELEQSFYDDIYTLGSGESANSVGVGGSLARFQIVEDYLYTVGEAELSTFNISNLSAPSFVTSYYAGWRIETMFHAEGYLYLGGDNGMFIHSVENPASPTFISEFTHWEGCDPVVVDGDYAFLTLRGGNECGQELSVLEVIDVSNKYNPTLVAQHSLDNPYGLGFKDNYLFVCDGNSGLKVYDKTNPLDLQMINAFEEINAKDVIPLEDKLLMIAEDALYQYEYNDEGAIQLLSTLILN
ncbi:LVIVD repeat-containing protein [Winogradskyella alexanderae]|uniref:LVIVD repeat-containing protein n=1 Tax=Winogradskyella alexanderae TaxID=2877123 RepID=A0ABS7XT63_9FLAO|nr:hypothetical protein [Winogradskyella alexanderae]MCA0132975.1 hypothetical protein [Winogradskyella alexanderae]